MSNALQPCRICLGWETPLVFVCYCKVPVHTDCLDSRRFTHSSMCPTCGFEYRFLPRASYLCSLITERLTEWVILVAYLLWCLTGVWWADYLAPEGRGTCLRQQPSMLLHGCVYVWFFASIMFATMVESNLHMLHLPFVSYCCVCVMADQEMPLDAMYWIAYTSNMIGLSCKAFYFARGLRFLPAVCMEKRFQ